MGVWQHCHDRQTWLPRWTRRAAAALRRGDLSRGGPVRRRPARVALEHCCALLKKTQKKSALPRPPPPPLYYLQTMAFSRSRGRLVVHVAREAAHGEASSARAPGEARRRHARSSAVAVWYGIHEKRDSVCGGRGAQLNGAVPTSRKIANEL